MRTIPSRRPSPVAAILCTALAACGGSDLTLPDLEQPARIVIVSGANQAGSVGTSLSDPLVVRVLDANDAPVPAARVVFVVSNGDGSVAPDTAVTDSDGRASAQWVLGDGEGTQRVEARVVGAEMLSVSFSATAGAGIASRIAAVSGGNQTATAGSLLPDSLIVRASDELGRPVAGVTVAWSVEGGGSVSAASTVTGPTGLTGVRRTLGPSAGEQRTLATVDGVEGSPVGFAATATVGSAGKLEIQVEPASNAKSGVPFSRQPQVQLLDANDNPVQQSGIAVVATIASGPSGATLTGSATASTNAQGLAVFTNLGISGGSGSYTLNFGGSQVSGATSAPIALSAGEAARLRITQQPPATAAAGQVLSPAPAVRLEDATGNAVVQGGVAVTVSIASGGGTLSGTTTVSTDGSGVVRFDDLAISGSAGTRTLIFASTGLAGATSTGVNITVSPSASASSIDAPASVQAGATADVTVTVRSASNEPLGGVTVALASSGDGDIVTAVSPVTDAGGVARFTVSGTTTGTRSLTGTAEGVTIGPRELTVTSAEPDPNETTAQVPDGRRFRTTVIVVTTRDRNGNRILTGGADIRGEVDDGPNEGVNLSVRDLGDGTYELTYIPWFTGTDEIAIRLDGEQIKGSPYDSRVRD